MKVVGIIFGSWITETGNSIQRFNISGFGIMKLEFHTENGDEGNGF
jgi:hypothetical protein